MNTSSSFNFLLVHLAFQEQIGRVAVENVDIFWHDIDVFEEIIPHEIVIRFGVLSRQIDVLVHVERLDVSKRDTSLLVEFDQFAVHSQRCATW